ncbi:FAD-dependent oxidoreductase [Neotabrizicola shimadae]|uniref:GMC family oxidoreductase n=1 Tax=Neotabrizicola shimadae TaxID=2807096 RepID=A0A8G0ZXF4_9RHOB|nr:GMC family oxidoreductase [Neotabrizicola shimadae]QYZ70485.1 GMC family oxidoreductase [Neotabrizicola shimadae]
MTPDVLIIGSGMGGATLAAALAPSGKRIVILERGERLEDCPEARDPAAIFGRGFFKPKETWRDVSGEVLNPGNYAFVGGNTKFYGAVLLRYRAEDFAPLRHLEGTTPGWPFPYAELERYYQAAEELYRVRGEVSGDPTEPAHSGPYPFPPIPDEPDIAALRRAFVAQGLHPSALPLGVDLDRWLARAPTTWDAFPDTTGAKSDAESCGLAEALKHPNVTLLTGARAVRLLAEGRRITGVEVERAGQRETLSAPVVCLCAGAILSAALLLASADEDHPTGLANGSDQVGRNFMNHNLTGMIACNPLRRNRSIYEKTIQVNDFYLTGGPNGEPLGNIQMLGRITGPILAGEAGLPLWLARHMADRSIHIMAMSEDLPDPDSRVFWRNGEVVLDWRRTNTRAHDLLVKKLGQAMRRAGWPIVLSRGFPKSKPSHQCGTARMGADPATSVVDAFGKAHDHDNLWILDASILPTSAAVNPSLTVAALALRAGERIREGWQ